MNIPVIQGVMHAPRALDGKVALVTGATSGIGLGVARALAAAGSAIVLNGFGKAEEIAALQSKLADEFKVVIMFSDADISRRMKLACTGAGISDVVVLLPFLGRPQDGASGPGGIGQYGS